MGVPGWLRQVLERYEKSHKLVKDSDCDNLFIDFNGLIYDAFHSIPYDELAKLKTETKIDNLVIKRVIEDLRNLIALVAPTKLCYIAVDGSVPRAKMIEQ